MKEVRLYPEIGGLFHFGIYNLDRTETIFHSDSLFSAIINNYAELYNDNGLNELFTDFPKISSMFHFIENKEKKRIYFLPRPFGRLNVFKDNQQADKNTKKIKKIKFISVGILKKINEGRKDINIESIDDHIIDVAYLITDEEKEILKDKESKDNNTKDYSIVTTYMEQKVSVPRHYSEDNEEETKTFYEEIFSLGHGENYKVGFYFLIDDLSTDEKSKRIKESIQLIKDEGLGGERSSGKGLFSSIIFDDTAFEKELGKESNKYMAISLVNPEDFDSVASYQLTNRKGFVYSRFSPNITYRKKSLWMLKEGSIFVNKDEGRIQKVLSRDGNLKHDVYRYGKAFLIPIKNVAVGDEE